MKFLPLLLILPLVLPLTSFKGPESCERLQPNRITIFPVCGDNSRYIKRRFELNKYIYEDVYKDGVLTISTKIWFSGREMPDSCRITEFTYWDGKLINTRSSSSLELSIQEKSFRINDSLHFLIRYHDNGFIMSYGLKKKFCWVYGVDSDPRNRFFWKGGYEIPVIDTVKNSKPTKPLEPSMAMNVKCGSATGMWRKLDLHGNVVDSIDMTGSRIDESASWRRYQMSELEGK